MSRLLFCVVMASFCFCPFLFAQTDSVEDLYEQVFGEKLIEKIFVEDFNVFINENFYDVVEINYKNISFDFIISKNFIIDGIKGYIEPKFYNEIDSLFNQNDISSNDLREYGFGVKFDPSKNQLFLSIPYKYLSEIIIDFNKQQSVDVNTDFKSLQKPLKFSGQTKFNLTRLVGKKQTNQRYFLSYRGHLSSSFSTLMYGVISDSDKHYVTQLNFLNYYDKLNLFSRFGKNNTFNRFVRNYKYNYPRQLLSLNLENKKLNNSGITKSSIKVNVKKKLELTLFNNESQFFSKTLVPGDYIFNNLPLKSGKNEILVIKKSDILETKKYVKYYMNGLRPLEYQYKYQFGYPYEYYRSNDFDLKSNQPIHEIDFSLGLLNSLIFSSEMISSVDELYASYGFKNANFFGISAIDISQDYNNSYNKNIYNLNHSWVISKFFKNYLFLESLTTRFYYKPQTKISESLFKERQINFYTSGNFDFRVFRMKPGFGFKKDQDQSSFFENLIIFKYNRTQFQHKLNVDSLSKSVVSSLSFNSYAGLYRINGSFDFLQGEELNSWKAEFSIIRSFNLPDNNIETKISNSIPDISSSYDITHKFIPNLEENKFSVRNQIDGNIQHPNETFGISSSQSLVDMIYNDINTTYSLSKSSDVVNQYLSVDHPDFDFTIVDSANSTKYTVSSGIAFSYSNFGISKSMHKSVVFLNKNSAIPKRANLVSNKKEASFFSLVVPASNSYGLGTATFDGFSVNDFQVKNTKEYNYFSQPYRSYAIDVELEQILFNLKMNLYCDKTKKPIETDFYRIVNKDDLEIVFQNFFSSHQIVETNMPIGEYFLVIEGYEVFRIDASELFFETLNLGDVYLKEKSIKIKLYD